MANAKRIAVIGGGSSGLVAIKCCLDEGLEPVCFERAEDIGGLWNFTEEIHPQQANVARSTVINTSKEFMCYSDFPIPAHFANFMHNTKIMEYFRMYADNFELLKHIRFNTEVLHITRSSDFQQSGKWTLKIKDAKKGEITEEYDAVIMCLGHHAEKYQPRFPGDDEFEGTIVHTHDYKDGQAYRGKRVMVVGVGNSGVDAAVELGPVAKQVYLCTRRGAWVFGRVDKKGWPIDVVDFRRYKRIIDDILPDRVTNFIKERQLNRRFNHALYGLEPKHRYNGQHPTMSDDLPNRIMCGLVQVKPNIKRLYKHGVEFEDGTVADLDAIISATGYICGFPCLDKSVIDVTEGNHVNLYKYVFPPDLEHPTLAVLGSIQPVGPIMPIAELQARWATRVFKGLIKLPSKEAMWADIKSKQEKMAKRYVKSPRHTIQVDWIPFMDEIAEQVGCKPQLGKLFLRDPKLASKLLFGPCSPYQYRLMGPGTWDGAKDAINTQWKRIIEPMQTRVLNTRIKDEGDTESGFEAGLQVLLVALVAIIAVLWLFTA